MRPTDVELPPELLAQVPQEAVEPFKTLVATVLSDVDDRVKVRLPAPGETTAVALLAPKTSALCFDRVWLPFNVDLPSEIAFFGGSQDEFAYAISAYFIYISNKATRSMPSLGRFWKQRLPLRSNGPLAIYQIFPHLISIPSQQEEYPRP
jgi:hypothetical protein